MEQPEGLRFSTNVDWHHLEMVVLLIDDDEKGEG